ncbi:malate dehydrogenase, cytoplasmic-like [Bolinopsis microptera]|uniref:malate dehydrogenase, cytoplasmic-like n=1 Tax=Bolinopsis microptera TaxID=2820187 RepID=UPI00307AB0C5
MAANKSPIKICITGGAGQIAYSLLLEVASGKVFGADQPVILHLLDIPHCMEKLNGVVMELEDLALSLVRGVVATDDPMVAFADVDVALLLGAFPRLKGMERKDLLAKNNDIFRVTGKAIDSVGKKSIKVVVVGNPCNTNALTCMKNAPSIPKENFTCLTRLDQNRAKSQLAHKLGVSVSQIMNVIIWGNHSGTQFPDARHASVVLNGVIQPLTGALSDDAWIKSDFITTVQSRGAAVIKARGLSSAMSAAKAIGDHTRDWWFGTKEGEFTSMGVISDGSYNIPAGIIYSFPVTIQAGGKWNIVQGLKQDDFATEKMVATYNELQEEATEAAKLAAEAAN